MSLRRIGSFWILALLWMCMAGAWAQHKSGSLPNAVRLGWSPGNEITLSGQIAEIPTTKAPGSPPGMNFVLNGTQHTLLVNAGTNLGETMRARLRTGVPVEVTGVMQRISGQDYLLARQLVVDGTTVPLRNANGFPVRPIGEAGPQMRSAKSRANGGAR